jgi:hypothetical protein
VVFVCWFGGQDEGEDGAGNAMYTAAATLDREDLFTLLFTTLFFFSRYFNLKTRGITMVM